MTGQAVTETFLGRSPDYRGKVRDIYALGETLLMVATDRLSAFDVVLPTPVPGRGVLLTRLSAFWFRRFASLIPNHLIRIVEDDPPKPFEAYREQLSGRTMLCRKCAPIPIECVVRAYLAGSGIKEYEATGSICGVSLPKGLRPYDRLPEPIFTPATKATEGHDENISFDRAAEQVGGRLLHQLRDVSLAMFQDASELALTKGLVIADTKFEFGLHEGQITLMDEVLTPDSSRYWAVEDVMPGSVPQSLDKQFVRNYLLDYARSEGWDFEAPGPPIPDSIVTQTLARYRRVYKDLTGESISL